MRPRTDSRSGKTSPAPLEKHFREIVVGSGRSQEPYIIAFHYASDNVAGSPLGTLFGFFEVEIHDQDAAYIVNFLASVAKKEYFANPRRSSVESFEAALHKINVALAEIVKHGNVSWLGHLHGALGAINQNTLNFSVTGEGEIYLAREEDLRSISTGLAENENEPHPLKTFTEVSSGELYDGDLIFALSPSVWSLFSPEDLRRSLNRLGPAGFEQFLRTALVNELPVAAVALVTCSAPVELKPPKPAPQKPVADLDNVWSDAPFAATRRAKEVRAETKTESLAEEKQEEYTDKKTGHIYVQASSDHAPETVDSPWKERWALIRHDLGTKARTWSAGLRKAGRRMGKNGTLALGAFGAQLSLLRRSLARKARSAKRASENRWQEFRQAREARKMAEKTNTASESMRERSDWDERTSDAFPDASTPTASALPTRQTSRISLTKIHERAGRFVSRCQPFLAKIRSVSGATGGFLGRQFASLFFWVGQTWQSLPPKMKWSVLGTIGIVIAIGLMAILRADGVPSVVEEPTPQSVIENLAQPVFPPAEEPLATLLTDGQLLFPSNNSKTIALTAINTTSFLVTEKAIINLKTQESTTTPEPIKLATAMDDLDAIFVLGESESLYLFSTVTKKFEKNALPIEAGARIDAIGAYLTYLYVLDQKAGAIYRFPRAEGGFGAPSRWLKESVNLATDGNLAVYENVALTLRNKEPAVFSRGQRMSAVFAGTKTLVTTDALTFDQETGDLLVLDRANKRIVRWSTAGDLLAQYFHETFGKAETFALSGTSDELLVSHQGETTAWRVQ